MLGSARGRWCNPTGLLTRGLLGESGCDRVCSYLYPANAPVTLNANPATGWNFAGWSDVKAIRLSCKTCVHSKLGKSYRSFAALQGAK
jgi:hypothetical protein